MGFVGSNGRLWALRPIIYVLTCSAKFVSIIMQSYSLNDHFCIFVYAGFIYEKIKCILSLPLQMIWIPLLVRAVLTNIIFSENIELF